MGSTARSGRRLARAAASCWLLLLAAGGHAAPLTGAGELRIFLGPFAFSDTGAGIATVQPGGALSLPAGLFTVAGVQATTLTGPIGLQASVSAALGAVSFGPGEGPAFGFGQIQAPVTGSAAIALLLNGVPIQTTFFPLVLLGNGGVFTFPPGPFDLSTPTGSWTTGAATRTLMIGSATTTIMVSGFDQRTPGGVGALRLVTPPTAVTFLGASDAFPVYATLDLVFAPEPSSGALLVAALAAAAAWRGRRLRRRVRGASGS
jgi:hypothetical protein